jgi:hypothetical protein
LKRGYDMARDQLWSAAQVESGDSTLPSVLSSSTRSPSPFEKGQG